MKKRTNYSFVHLRCINLRMRILLFLTCVVGISAMAQIKIDGIVKDEVGNPMPSVSIALKDFPSRTNTDNEVKFSINANVGDGILNVGQLPNELSSGESYTPSLAIVYDDKMVRINITLNIN